MDKLPTLPKLKKRKRTRKFSRSPETVPGMRPRDLPSIEERRNKCATGLGSLPERMTRFALLKLDIPFQEQQTQMGGAVQFAVIDFVLSLGVNPIALRVQSYFHTDRERVAWDLVQASRLHAMGFEVRDLWEQDLYAAADQNCGQVIKVVNDAIFNF